MAEGQKSSSDILLNTYKQEEGEPLIFRIITINIALSGKFVQLYRVIWRTTFR
jgi:hypothetical protein